jgi:excisionase family DNA binding protein
MSYSTERETLTVEEAGRVLGLGRNKAYEAVSDGSIPSLRFGGRIVIPRQAIDRLLATSNQPDGSSTNETIGNAK